MWNTLSLLLLTDLAKRRMRKLFVCSVDFSMAYDSVPRIRFGMLHDLGCRSRMLAALAAMNAAMWIGTAAVEYKIGVRQGFPTSCLLFIVFVNAMIKLIKSNCRAEGFLQWLHLLVLMDDTVLLSMHRGILNQICVSNGMLVNNLKTKFFFFRSPCIGRGS